MSISVTEIINTDRARRKANTTAYNQITGEGSISLPRQKVEIEGFPIHTMWLPTDFVNTQFIKKLSTYGFDGFIKTCIHAVPTDAVKEDVYVTFCQERIKFDFEFYAVMCLTISYKNQGHDGPFMLNRAQRHYLRELETLRLANKPIDVILCKARQWGGSTLTDLYQLWIMTVHRNNWNCVICGNVDSQASTVAGMLELAIRNIPLWATNDQEIKTNPYQGLKNTRTISLSQSRYSIGSAQHPEALRSQDISMAHLTEVGIWQKTRMKSPEDLVQSIFGSVNGVPYSMKALESTAKGVGNYFHRTWMDAVAGKNNFTPVFIPWFLIDIYQKKLNANERKELASNLNSHEKWMFGLGATLDAIAWYRDKEREIADPWRMKSEFPSSAEEAFQSTGRRFFPNEYVEKVKQNCLQPCFFGEFVGDAEKGKSAFENITFHEITPKSKEPDDVLWVWFLPDTSARYRNRYIVSVDIGGVGRNSDYSEIKVADRLPMVDGGVPEIVAEWHGHIEHDLLIWKAAQIAKAYDNALLIVESNTLETEGTEGDNFEYIMDEIVPYYYNLYSRTSSEQIKQGKPQRYGFHTNSSTKPMVTGFTKSAMRGDLYIERSMPTCLEFDMFEIKDDGKKTGATEGNHDDRVMATCILVWACYKIPLPTIIDKSISERIKNKTTIVSEASF